MTYTFQKDSGKRDFINAIQRQNLIKLAPNHYKPFDADGFVGTENLRKVRFAFGKDLKNSIIEAEAKKKMWVPAANAYSPERKQKPIGNYLL